MTSQPKIVLHWLDQSRSQRIVWLLEELELEYEVKVYYRDPKTFRAPESLKKVHPLGKSPIIEVDGKVIGESGHMAQYLVSKFDKKQKLSVQDEDEQERIDYYLHYAEGTLQPFQVMLLIAMKVKEMSPFVMKPLVNTIVNKMNAAYAEPELEMNLKYLDEELSKNPSGFFVGSKLSAADIILSFPLKNAINRFGITKQSHPHILAWYEKIKLLDGYQRAQAKVEEFGKSK